jgi:hypothetical protein
LEPLIKSQLLYDALRSARRGIITGIVARSASAISAWRRALEVGRLNTSDPHLTPVEAPERPIAIVHPDDLADERWRQISRHGVLPC